MSCSRIQRCAPSRLRMRRISRIANMKASRSSSAIRYSTVITTGPLCGTTSAVMLGGAGVVRNGSRLRCAVCGNFSLIPSAAASAIPIPAAVRLVAMPLGFGQFSKQPAADRKPAKCDHLVDSQCAPHHPTR